MCALASASAVAKLYFFPVVAKINKRILNFIVAEHFYMSSLYLCRRALHRRPSEEFIRHLTSGGCYMIFLDSRKASVRDCHYH